jgi:hypothetical protein
MREQRAGALERLGVASDLRAQVVLREPLDDGRLGRARDS